MVGPQRPQFVLFGSSIVQFSFSHQGWGASLSDIYARKADIILRGYAGWNSSRALQVLDHVFPQDARVQPALAIVYFGGNDSMNPHPSGLGPHVPLPKYVENMKKIAIHLKGLAEMTRVIFLSTPPVNEDQIRQAVGDDYFEQMGRTNKNCQKYSDALVELCQGLGFKVIDLFNAIQKKEDWLTTCFTDGIHLSADGSKIVVREILKVLREAEWEPSLHWKSMPTEFSENSPYDIIGPDGNPINSSDSNPNWDPEWEDPR